MDNTKWKYVENVLCSHIREGIAQMEKEHISELRIRVGKPLEMCIKGVYRLYPVVVATKQDVEETFEFITKHSIYAVVESLKEGYITLEGGHRVGICGHGVQKDGRLTTIRDVSSINIRVSRELFGIGDGVLPYLWDGEHIKNTIIVSPPCCGKTTLVRELTRKLSHHVQVGVVDERSEIAAMTAQGGGYELGPRTDVMDNCPKPVGIKILVRTMAPRVIIMDEIGTRADAQAVLEGVLCGVSFIATAHGGGVLDIEKNDVLNVLLEQQAVTQAIVLTKEFITKGLFRVLPVGRAEA